MFDVGFTEILLIGIVSLVVIGPERLPAVAKTAGQWVGKLQRFVRGVKTDLASELESGDLKKLIGDQREQIDELRKMVSTATQDIQQTTQSVVKSTREGLSELETSVKEAKEDLATTGDADDASIGSATPSAHPTSTSSTSTPTSSSAKNETSSTSSAQADDVEEAPVKRTGTTDSDRQ